MQSLWILASGFLFALCALCIKLGASDFSGLELVLYRSVFGLVIMYVFLLMKHDTPKTRHFVGHFKRSTAAWLSMVIWMGCVPMIPLATSLTLGATTPIFIATVFIALAIFKKTPVSWPLIISIFTGFLGIVLMMRPSFSPQEVTGCLMAVASAAVSAYSFWQIKELSLMRESSYRIVFYVSLFGLIYSFIGVLVMGEGFSPVTSQNAVYLAGIGLTAGFGQLCLTFAYGKGNMLLSSCLQYSSIVFSQIFGFFCFAETIDTIGVIGIVLIAASGVFATSITRSIDKGKPVQTPKS